jgi:hypothetical protein
MTFRPPRSAAIAVLALTLGLLFPFARNVRAQDHVATPADLQQQIQNLAHDREQNLATVQKFLSQERVKKVLKTARMDPQKVQKALPSLSDEELARLASQADKAQQDIAAGALTNQQITYIIIAMATALIVILAFVA